MRATARSSFAWRTAAAVALSFQLVSPVFAVCIGDCDRGSDVTVDEILVMLQVALGADDVTACAPGDGNYDGAITVDEVVRAVSIALSGCPAPCDPLPIPDAATGILGPQEDGTFLGHNGRRAGGIGTSVVLDAVAQGFATHPIGPWAYVSEFGRDGRVIQVVDFETGEILQTVSSVSPQGRAVLSPDGTRLFVPLGTQERIATFDVGADGLLTRGPTVNVGRTVVALQVSADGTTLWAGYLTDTVLLALDLPSLEERAQIQIEQGAWQMLELPGRHELWIADLASDRIAVVDTATDTRLGGLRVRSSAADLAASADESTVWVAMSGGDTVVAIDTDTREVAQTGSVSEGDLVDEEGDRLPHSNPNSLVYEPETDRLFVTRGADNAVSVLDARTLEQLGSLPTSWWPTDIAIGAAPGDLLLTEGYGGGTDPEPEPDGERININNGTLTRVDLSTLDLEATTRLVQANERRSLERYDFDCPAGTFPIPTRPGQTSPIEHVILVVKENKTFDSYFGDIDIPGVDGDPSLVRWGAEIIPNHRKIAREFNLSDRFFLEAQESDSGHLFLTNAHNTEFTERIFTENPGDFGITWPLRDPSVPDTGTVFTHLLNHGKSIRIFGEIVGTTTPAADGTLPSRFSDFRYPGGPVYSNAARDRDRAAYVVEWARTNGLPDFTYMLLPNDHTEGTTPGRPTPESHVADNDDAIGVLVDGISHIEALWRKTAIIILEDDPQGSGDHVNKARSFLMVASPWARREYLSHHQASFVSVHATIFRILGVPPNGRHTATAAPLWDLFTEEPDFTPYERLPRTYPEEVNPAAAFAARASARMDFRSPDRNPDLGRVLGLYRAVKMGILTREQAEWELSQPLDDEEYEELVEEAIEETTAWERDVARFEAWLAEQGLRLSPDGRVVPAE